MIIPKENNRSIRAYSTTNYDYFRDYDRIKFKLTHMESSLKKASSLLDIGCAKGELIYLMKEKFPHIKYTGLEYNQELIEIAQKESFLNTVNFVNGDARDFNLNQSFDIVLMSGVLSIFDDFSTVIQNMLNHISSNGVCYIFGMFNPKDMDVIIRFRNNYNNSVNWESGFNNFSLKTIKKYIFSLDFQLEVFPFKISTVLKPADNPIRSYTLSTTDNELIITNGIGIITNFYLLKIYKNKR